MSIDLLEQRPFELNGKTYEVWIYRDKTNWEFRVSVRLDQAPIVFEGEDGVWAGLTYVVSIEQEVDSRMDNLPSVLETAVAQAKSDLDRPHRKVVRHG